MDTFWLGIEKALDAHRLYLVMPNGKCYLMRRNGMTKRWKKDPERFEIPCKYAFRGYYKIDDSCRPEWFRVADSREEAESVTHTGDKLCSNSTSTASP